VKSIYVNETWNIFKFKLEGTIHILANLSSKVTIKVSLNNDMLNLC